MSRSKQYFRKTLLFNGLVSILLLLIGSVSAYSQTLNTDSLSRVKPVKKLVLFIGSEYQGGIVFWLSDDGQHGLLAAPEDISIGGETSFPWSDILVETGATDTSMGSGQKNTNTIILKQGLGNYAAKLCADYVLVHDSVAYTDWYLPAKLELEVMCDWLFRKDWGNFTPDSYWSSTEASNGLAWGMLFYYGDKVTFNKFGRYRVRPVRAF